MRKRRVAVFDANLPTGVSMVRSLGRAGVPVTTYHHETSAMGRYSRYSGDFELSPDLEQTNVFVEWLTDEIETGRIDLVAPTSDLVMFNHSLVMDALGLTPPGYPTSKAVRTTLFKHQFAAALEETGFPTPKTAAPTSIEEALEFAAVVGFPLLIKPRSHVGAGVARGDVVRDQQQLLDTFAPYPLSTVHSRALSHDPDLAWPLLQQFLDVEDLEVISVTGFLDESGEPLALDHSRKVRQWPPTVGVGTHFVSEPAPEFSNHAVRTVQQILGTGIFEFEVLFDRRQGRYWGIDLNPRIFGQASLDIARGHDLPALWYEQATGIRLGRHVVRQPAPTDWQMRLPLGTDLAVHLLKGPRRASTAREVVSLLRAPSVGAVSDWRDPLPGLHFHRGFLRHPGGLVRPFLERQAQQD